MEEDRPRQVPLLARLGLEQGQVHPARPGPQIAKAARRQIVAQRLRRHHRALRRAMEAAHPGVDRAKRKSRPRVEVFGEAGMERRGEGEAGPPGPASRRHAERAFRRDVQRVRTERLDQADHPPARQQRERDVAVGRTRDGAEPVRPDHLHHVAHGAQFSHHGGQRAHHAVGLRQPGVGDDQQPVRGRGRQHRVAAGRIVEGQRVRQLRATGFGAARRTTAGFWPPSRSVRAARRDVPPERCSFPPNRRR